jgi:hypothetical protein
MSTGLVAPTGSLVLDIDGDDDESLVGAGGDDDLDGEDLDGEDLDDDDLDDDDLDDEGLDDDDDTDRP